MPNRFTRTGRDMKSAGSCGCCGVIPMAILLAFSLLSWGAIRKHHRLPG